MVDREKVIAGLKCCATNRLRREDCEAINCTYLDLEGRGCIHQLIRDALAMLKAQEPRVMTMEEAQANVQNGPFIIVEVRDSTGSEVDFGVLVGDYYEMSEGSVLTVEDFGMMKDDYGKRFRLWTSRPDEKRRAETPWGAQEQREYEAAVEMAEYCERYEPTYNADDGSM